MMILGCLMASLVGAQNDPMRPENYIEKNFAMDANGKVVNQNLMLTLIYVSEKQRYAVVNDKILKRNDTVLGNTILEINPNNIVVSKHGIDKTLLLIRNEVSIRNDE